jgi:hypothetical protein
LLCRAMAVAPAASGSRGPPPAVPPPAVGPGALPGPGVAGPPGLLPPPRRWAPPSVHVVGRQGCCLPAHRNEWQRKLPSEGMMDSSVCHFVPRPRLDTSWSWFWMAADLLIPSFSPRQSQRRRLSGPPRCCARDDKFSRNTAFANRWHQQAVAVKIQRQLLRRQVRLLLIGRGCRSVVTSSRQRRRWDLLRAHRPRADYGQRDSDSEDWKQSAFCSC